MPWLVPQFVKDLFGAEDPIHDIVVDNSRNILYALSKNNKISVFDLGDDGETFLYVHQQDVWQMVRQHIPRNQGANLKEYFKKKVSKTQKYVISLHVVEKTDTRSFRFSNIEPEQVHLIALCRDGMRLYMTTSKKRKKNYNNFNSSKPVVETGPKTLSLVHGNPGTTASVRAAPASYQVQKITNDDIYQLGIGQRSYQVSSNQVRPYIVSTGFCDRNVCIMAERETGNGGVGADSDSITAFCFDTAHQLFGSVKTRDPFVINKLLDAENQGRGNRNRNNNVLSVYNKELSLKESVHHTNNNVGRIYEIALSERPKSSIDYHMMCTTYTPPKTKGRQAARYNNQRNGGVGMNNNIVSNNAGQKRSYNNISSTDGRNTSTGTSYKLEYLRLGVLATQHREFVKTVLCLSTKGLYRYEILKPVEQLRRLLSQCNRASFRNQVEKFRDLYGRAETCAMALILICSLPEVIDDSATDIPFDSYAPGTQGDAAMRQTNFAGTDAVTAANIVVDRAKQIFFQNTWSGSASNINIGSGSMNRHNNGSMAMSQGLSINFSGRREGIAFYLSRLVRPFWEYTFVEKNPSYAPVRLGVMGYVDRLLDSARTLTTGRNGLYMLRFNRELLGELFRPVERLRQFMERHSTNGNNKHGYSLDCRELPSHDIVGGSDVNNNETPYGRTVGSKNNLPMDAETMESRSLAELYHLTTRCSQALEALRILAAPQHNFPRLVSSGIRRSEREERATSNNDNTGQQSNGGYENMPLLSDQSLEELTFKQLITTKRGGKVITALLFELMSSLSFDTSNVQDLCRDLESRCPMFFSSFTGRLVVGNVYLKRAESHGTDRPRERQDLLDAALEEYVRATEELEKSPDLHSVHIIEDACEKFEKLRFYEGVLILMLSAAHHVAKGRTKHVDQNWDSITGVVIEDIDTNSYDMDNINNMYGNMNMNNNNRMRYNGTSGYGSPSPNRNGIYTSPPNWNNRNNNNSSGRSNNRANTNVDNDKNKRLNIRKRMYNYVIKVTLDNLIYSRVNDMYDENNQRELHDAERYEQDISDFLNRAQKYEDACFHNDLYSYLLHKKENSRYERLSSKEVESFLHRMIEDTASTGLGKDSEATKYYNSLSNYYIKNNRLKAAANLAVKRAKWDEINIENNPELGDRLIWLNEAIRLLNSSRIAYGAPGVDDDVIGETVESLEGDRDVAMEQKMLWDSIKNVFNSNNRGNEFQKECQKFRYKLIDVSSLYKIAKRYQLWENCLSIIFCCDQRDDKIYRSVQSCWRQLIESSLMQTVGREYHSHLRNRGVWVEAVMKTITIIGRRFYGKGRDFVVPVQYIVALMEGLLMESGEDVVENSGILSSDYVPQCLREIGVPWLDIINAYEKAVEDPEDVRNAVDTMLVSRQAEQIQRRSVGSNTRKLHCLIMLEHIVRMWMEYVDNTQIPDEMDELVQNEPILNDMIMRWRAASGGLLNLPQIYEQRNLKNTLMKRFQELLVNKKYLPGLQRQRLQDM